MMATAIVISGVFLAGTLRDNPTVLEQLYQKGDTPQLLLQPGGIVRTISDEWMFATVTWSPDGSRLAMNAMPKISMFKFFGRLPPMTLDPRRQGEAGMRWVLGIMGPRVVIIEVASREEEVIWEGDAETMQWGSEVVWLPDGQRLAVVSREVPVDEPERETGPPQLWIVNVDGSERRKIADNVGCPTISPDSRWIACCREDEEADKRFVVVLDAEDGSEVWTFQRNSRPAAWSPTSEILYFWDYETESDERSCQRVRLPEGRVEAAPMKLIERPRRTSIGPAEDVFAERFDVSEDGAEHTHRLGVRNYAQGGYDYLTPQIHTCFSSPGACLGGRYALIRTSEALWAYRLADGKFYQVTDPQSLSVGWEAELDPSGTKVCIVGDLPEEEVYRVFTTGLSTPVMVLTLDEERILSQPGYDEPVVPSSDEEGEQR